MFRSDLRRQSSPSGSDCESQSVLVWRSEINDTRCLACDSPAVWQYQLPVVTVDVVQPAALFDHLDHSGHILPGGEAVKPLIFLSGAGDHTAEVPPTLQRGGQGGWRVVVVVDTLLSVWATQDRTWGGDVTTCWQHIHPDQWFNVIDAKWEHCSVSFSLRFEGWKIPTAGWEGSFFYPSVVLQAGHRFIYSAQC